MTHPAFKFLCMAAVVVAVFQMGGDVRERANAKAVAKQQERFAERQAYDQVGWCFKRDRLK